MIRKDSAAQVLNKELVGSDTVGQNQKIIKWSENREELASSIASSIFCTRLGSQENVKGLINKTGHNTGDANGSIFTFINTVNIQIFGSEYGPPAVRNSELDQQDNVQRHGSGYLRPAVRNLKLDQQGSVQKPGSEDVQPSFRNFKHDLQGSVNENSSQKPAGEPKVTCRGCRRESIMPSNTTIYRCPACQVINTSISGYGQSNKESGIHMIKPTARNLKLDQQGTVNKNVYLQNSISSPSTGSSLILPRRCNKRAVLCGVTYKTKKFKLKGTINDVMNMKELLVKIFDFPNECIRVLTDQAENANIIPNKKNMLESLKWLVEDCQPGDSLVFYFSGHGLQQVDAKEDEIDGYDQNICPVDFIREGIILDNDINYTIVWPLKEGVTLHAIIDACHSGIVLDLTNVYDPENCKWIDNKPLNKEPLRKHTSGGLAICLNACKDGQMAADTTAFPGKGRNGVMTYLLKKIIKQNLGITYECLLAKMEVEIQQVIKNNCRPTFLQHIFCKKISQNFRSSRSISSSLILPKRFNKRAVLCGINYGKRKSRLKGTINDVMNMKEMLLKGFYFSNECIRVLTEQAENADLILTKKNMLDSLKWLVEDCQPGDSLVFYFSGHGLKQVDAREDETDVYDETICPVDFMREGIILDNDFNSTIVWPLKEGVTLHAIVDACHSGTVLDLTNVYDPENCKWIDNKPLAKQPLRKHTSGGLVICLSACKDGQMAANTTVRTFAIKMLLFHHLGVVICEQIYAGFPWEGNEWCNDLSFHKNYQTKP